MLTGRRGRIAVLSVLALLAAGCSSDGGGPGRITVAATIAPVTAIVAAIAGDRADVVGLVPESVDSRFYAPATRPKVPKDAVAVFVNGLALDERLVPAGDSRVVALAPDALPQPGFLYDFAFPRSGARPNPYLWTDPVLAAKYSDLVTATLTRLDRRNARVYARNHEAFVRDATRLRDAVLRDAATIGATPTLLTYDAGYDYLARTLHWQVAGAPLVAHPQSPSPDDADRLVLHVRAARARSVFGPPVFGAAFLAELGKRSGARYESSLRREDLPGKPSDAAHSWFGLVQRDARTLVRGLGGTDQALAALKPPAPPRASYPEPYGR